jgi:single-strand selective monofunctional uracil DNA glycosylase
MSQADVRRLIAMTDHLSAQMDTLHFSEPVTHVYNPLAYAREAVCDYLQQYGQGPKKVLFLGMNPGPFGMAQTGVPFGEVAAVRDWLGVSGQIGKPPQEHPARPIQGFSCPRSEVSGARLWGFFRDEFGSPADFFRHAFVWNYCPLLFSEIGQRQGRKVCRNLTPDKVVAQQRRALFEACDDALVQLVDYYQPQYLVGVGSFAEACYHRLFGDREQMQIARILHPSPASPLANRDFAGTARSQLMDLGLVSLMKST